MFLNQKEHKENVIILQTKCIACLIMRISSWDIHVLMNLFMHHAAILRV